MQSGTAPTNEHQAELVCECVGRPVRISFFMPGTVQLLARVYGGIDELEPGRAIAVDCHGVVEALPSGCPTVVEVMVGSEFIILETTLERTNGANALVLGWPHGVRTQQRRLHQRVDVELPLHFLVPGTPAAQKGMMDNLGAGGLAFTTADPVSVGSSLTIAFGLGSGCYFTGIDANVVRCTPLQDRGYQVGVRFVDPPPNTFQKLKEWVDKRATATEGGQQLV